MPTIQEVADKMGIDVAEANRWVNSAFSTGQSGIAKALMAGYGWSEDSQPGRLPTEDASSRNEFVIKSIEEFVDEQILIAAAAYIDGKADLAQLKTVVRNSAQLRFVEPPRAEKQGDLSLSWEGNVPVIRITPDMAALLSLSPIAEAVAPANTYRIAIVAPFCKLTAIEATGDRLEGRWLAGAPSRDLAEPIKNIALGACDLLSKSSEPRIKHEPDPVGRTQARMHDTVTIKIRTLIGDAIKEAARDVFEGRRGYSQVLAESIPVRAHLARYHVGPGRAETVLILRAAHRRGGPGTKERTYVLQS